MTFVKRNLFFEIKLDANSSQLGSKDQSQDATFDKGGTTLSLQGIRSRATIQSSVGGDTAYSGMAVVQIWGMDPNDMAKLSTMGFDQGKIGRNTISIQAGDDESGNYAEVFSGGIFSAHINYNEMPDVSVTLECYATINEQAQAIPGTSAPGAADVAAMLQGICAACNPPLNFINSGVTAVLSNHAVAGSAAQQIKDICLAAGICHEFQPTGTLRIWPKDQSKDGVVVSVTPGKGMVGHPEYTSYGLAVTTEFDPAIQLGRQMKINQPDPVPGRQPYKVPGVPGTFWICIVSHDLSAELPGGPWFTRAELSNQQIIGFH